MDSFRQFYVRIYTRLVKYNCIVVNIQLLKTHSFHLPPQKQIILKSTPSTESVWLMATEIRKSSNEVIIVCSLQG